MAVTLIDHINIATDRLSDTVAFYEAVLGLTVGDRPDFPFPGAWLYAGDRAIVHLVGTASAKLPCDGAALNHFAFESHDYDQNVARLEAAGVTYKAQGVPGWPIRQLFFNDPNGVTIELNHNEG